MQKIDDLVDEAIQLKLPVYDENICNMCNMWIIVDMVVCVSVYSEQG